MKVASPLLLPKFAKLKGRRVYNRIRSKLSLLVFLSILAAVIGIVLSPFFVPLFFSSTYKTAVPFTQLFFVSLAFGLPSIVFLTLLQARKRIRSMYTYQVTTAVITIVALLVLIPKFGILGACIAKLIIRYVSSGQLWFFARSC